MEFGGYIALGLFGHSSSKVYRDDTYSKLGPYDTFPNRGRFDTGLTLGVSYGCKSFIYSIQSKYGFKNIDPLTDSGKIVTYYFNIGYKF